MIRQYPLTSGGDHALSTAIGSATSSIQFFLTAPKVVGCYQLLLQRAKAGLALDLIVPIGKLNKLGLTARYVEKIQAAGGRFFLVNQHRVDWQKIKLSSRDLLLIDNQTCWRPAPGNDGWLAATDEVLLWRAQLQQLRETGKIPGGTSTVEWFAKSGLSESGRQQEPGMKITFRADQISVQPGQQTRLQWSVPGAEIVDVQPRPGRVPASGKRSVQITEPTEFTLTARRGEATTAKVLTINIDQRVGLKYWLMSEDPADPTRSLHLKEQPELPGHFGVLEGLEVTLHWETVNAQTTRLNGAPVPSAGERKLLPAGLMTLDLEAVGITGDNLEKPITIKVFAPQTPVPTLGNPAEFSPAPPTKMVNLQRPTAEINLEGNQDLLPLPDDSVRQELLPKDQGVFSRLQKWFKNEKP